MVGSDNPLGKKKWFTPFTGDLSQRNTLNMYDSLIAQQFQIFGIPIEIVSSDVNENKDRIFGEDTTKKYIQKHKMTCLLKEGSVEETLQFNSFGQLNIVEFSLYLHIDTFKNLLGKDVDPKPSDLVFLSVPDGPDGAGYNSNLGFEVMHVGFSTLGLEGNILGRRTLYELVVREREVSEATVGQGEQYGIIQTIRIPQEWVGDLISIVEDFKIKEITVTSEIVGQELDMVIEGAPLDGILPSGEIASKYRVRGHEKRSQTGDNEFIRNVTDEIDGVVEDPIQDGKIIDVRKDGNVVPRSRQYWGNW